MAPTLGHDLEEHCFLNTPAGWLRITADAQRIRELALIEAPPLTARPPSLPHLKDAYRELMASINEGPEAFQIAWARRLEGLEQSS